MRRRSAFVVAVLAALTLAGAARSACALQRTASSAEPIVVVSHSLHGARTHRPFIVYGFNYLRRTRSTPEEYLATQAPATLAVIRRDFRRMRRLGANTVRIYLQLPTFMSSPTVARPPVLRALRTLLGTASQTGVRLDVTGDLVWHPATSPAWYEHMGEAGRWRVQAAFWRQVAKVCRHSPAVLLYELTSEPIVSNGIDPHTPNAWYTGNLQGNFFVQRIALDTAERSPQAIARAWIVAMRTAVRANDTLHPISVGLLADTSRDGAFAARNVAPLLDVLTVHLYPQAGKADEAISALRGFAATGKPVMLGEAFELDSGPATQRAFLLGGRRYLVGVLSFFDGRTASQVPVRADPRMNPEDARYTIHYRSTLTHFLALRRALAQMLR